MKNKHGLECPLDWRPIGLNYKWLAVDADGEIWAYENKPKVLGNPHWQSVDFALHFLGYTAPPVDFTRCIWQRPK